VTKTLSVSASNVTVIDPVPAEATGGVSFAPARVVEKIVAADIGTAAKTIPRTAVRLALTKTYMESPYMCVQ
jgi:hypothetical protein